jgi:ubiquinone/menaquinone biosynthesis C-methylase UbiE
MLRYFPRSNYTGIDFSSKMLAVAASRLKKCDQHVKLQMLDLNEGMPSGSFDVIVSLFTIHHVLNKKRLFKHLFSLLKAGGCFFYGDVTVSRNKRLEKRFIENWRDFMTKSGLPKGKIEKVIKDHRRYDLPVPLETQLHFLKAAGFESYDIVWCRAKNAAFFATK